MAFYNALPASPTTTSTYQNQPYTTLLRFSPKNFYPGVDLAFPLLTEEPSNLASRIVEQELEPEEFERFRTIDSTLGSSILEAHGQEAYDDYLDTQKAIVLANARAEAKRQARLATIKRLAKRGLGVDKMLAIVDKRKAIVERIVGGKLSGVCGRMMTAKKASICAPAGMIGDDALPSRNVSDENCTREMR
ncbi:hypothetical protein MMC25_004629 [Agyrium rufum]|nr:hypothetical protein [Agyrium rufum]